MESCPCTSVEGPLIELTVLFPFQGVRYRYFELGKNADPEKENDPRFKNAFTAHPVLDPVQMYRLHKHFAKIELERAYDEIQQLQVRNGEVHWGAASPGPQY